MPGTWRFFGPELSRAIDEWRTTYEPSEEQVAAFYEWAMALTHTGPTEGSLRTSDPDEYVMWVSGANVFVTLLAVEQDLTVFVRRIDPS